MSERRKVSIESSDTRYNRTDSTRMGPFCSRTNKENTSPPQQNGDMGGKTYYLSPTTSVDHTIATTKHSDLQKAKDWHREHVRRQGTKHSPRDETNQNIGTSKSFLGTTSTPPCFFFEGVRSLGKERERQRGAQEKGAKRERERVMGKALTPATLCVGGPHTEVVGKPNPAVLQNDIRWITHHCHHQTSRFAECEGWTSRTCSSTRMECFHTTGWQGGHNSCSS